MSRKPGIAKPLAYYGGKEKLLPELLKLVPPHTGYVEPFIGGGSLFWAKRPSRIEILNDKNDRLIQFYEVVQTQYEELKEMAMATLHSERAYKNARHIYNNPENYGQVQVAWSVWANIHLSFSNGINNGFAFNSTDPKKASIYPKKHLLTEALVRRLDRKHVKIFSRDFQDVPKSFKRPGFFWYLDPPYLESNKGHYADWTESDEERLLTLCEELSDSGVYYLLSGYDNEIRANHRARNPDLRYRTITKALGVSGSTSKGKKKVETLTWNYQEPNEQLSIFTSL